jgi:3-hydroxymyristoyl/3-hydroxydecanoyl-(acyl carrier protein) dehydratase
MPSRGDPWLPLEEIRISPSGRLEAGVCLEVSSPWFSGHFETCAVVPGVALLAFVAETVRRHGERQGRSLGVTGFSKVRFRRVTFPDDRLRVSVDPMPSVSEAELPFFVTCGGESVVQGMMRVAEVRGKKPALES